MENFNIYYRQDGRWEGRIYKKNEEGKRKYQSFFGRTREEVIEKMTIFNPVQPYKSCLLTFGEIFTEWLQSIRHRVKESTLANYLVKWEKHIIGNFGDMTVTSILPSKIYEFIAQKQDAGLSNRYITDILVLIKSIFKFASNTYSIQNIMTGIAMPKKKAPEIKLLDDKQQCRLQEYFSTHKNNMTLGMALASVTGLRIGELCSLQWKDIDFKKRVLTVSKTIQRIKGKNGSNKTKIVITEPKSETSKRKIPIPECIMEFLEQFRGDDEEYICSGNQKPVEPRKMQRHFVKVLKNVDLPSIHFHALRHMFATKCVKLGFDIKTLSEILGHSNIKITIPVPNSNTKPVAVPTDKKNHYYNEQGRYLTVQRYRPTLLFRSLFSFHLRG